MTTPSLPPCGLYRTLDALGEIPAGRLVYFHNHGDPGPGVYFPEKWTHNRAHFAERGTLLPQVFDSRSLKQLPNEGLYRVTSAFFCCDKNCVRFEPESLVQLAYNGAGDGLLFFPEFTANGLRLPERGAMISDEKFAFLSPLTVRESSDSRRDRVVH